MTNLLDALPVTRVNKDHGDGHTQVCERLPLVEVTWQAPKLAGSQERAAETSSASTSAASPIQRYVLEVHLRRIPGPRGGGTGTRAYTPRFPKVPPASCSCQLQCASQQTVRENVMSGGAISISGVLWRRLASGWIKCHGVRAGCRALLEWRACGIKLPSPADTFGGALQVKEDGWWLVLGSEATDELHAVKRISFGEHASTRLSYTADTAGSAGHQLHLVSGPLTMYPHACLAAFCSMLLEGCAPHPWASVQLVAVVPTRDGAFAEQPSLPLHAAWHRVSRT